MKIKDLPSVDRPREKMQKYGPEKLSNAELLAILIRTGSGKFNAIDLAFKIFKQFGGSSLAHASVISLQKVSGLGSVKALEIAACFELGKRLLKDKQAKLLLSPREVWEQLKDIREQKKEHFVVFFLNTQNQVVEREIISIGTLSSNLVHPREVFEPAIKHTAAHIIVAHNHPSGSLEPSKEDVEVTHRLTTSAGILGIELLDHVIVTAAGYMSFKEKEML